MAFRVKQQHGTSGSSTYQEFNSIKASKQEPDAEIDCGRIELKEHNIASEKEENKCTEITGASAFGQLTYYISSVHTCSVHFPLHAVNDDSKAVPVSEFSRHVERLHADEHHLLEMEYMVRYECVCKHAGVVASYYVAQLYDNFLTSQPQYS